VHAEQKIDYLEALNIYFMLKKNYEEAVFSAKRDAYLSAKTKSAAKRQIALIKPKCINCRKPGGTIFEHKDDKYTAVCGVQELHNKCNLNIQLYRGHFSDQESLLYIFKNSVDEVKEKISNSVSGEKNGFYGKTHTSESIEKIKKSKIGSKHTEETKVKMSKSSKRMYYPHTYGKSVLQYDMENNFIKKYNSIKEASEETGCHRSRIIDVCKGKRKHTKNFVWIYE
jgi:hypothetical protein